MKDCTKCGQTLGEEEFYRRPDRSGILRPWCKKCHNQLTSAYRAKRLKLTGETTNV